MQSETAIHVAFVDDHDSVRESLIMFLTDLGGISIDIEASSGEELIKKFEEAEQLPEICILDFQMPAMDGYSLLMYIKKQWPQMKVLVFTGYDHEALVIRMIKAGANGYLLKNCKPAVLKEALQAIQSTGYYYSQQAPSKFFDFMNNVKELHFSESEIDFIRCACTDLSYAEIAAKMNKTAKSVEGYRDRVCRKLTVSNRAGIIMYAIQSGLVLVETKL